MNFFSKRCKVKKFFFLKIHQQSLMIWESFPIQRNCYRCKCHVFFKVSIERQTITVTFALRKKRWFTRSRLKQIPNSTNFFEAVDLSGRLRSKRKKFFWRYPFEQLMSSKSLSNVFSKKKLFPQIYMFCLFAFLRKKHSLTRYNFTNFRWFKWTILLKEKGSFDSCLPKKRMTQSTSNFKNLHAWIMFFPTKHSLHKYTCFAYLLFWEKKKHRPTRYNM